MRTLLTASLLVLCFACDKSKVEVSEDTGGGAGGAAATGAGAAGEPIVIDKGDGLKVEITEMGSGPAVQRDDILLVHYRGRLASNGKEFDSSFSRHQPYKFTLGRDPVIDGWKRGFDGMRVGTKATLHIPAALGYGKRGMPPFIPADADLIFEVHLVDAR